MFDPYYTSLSGMKTAMTGLNDISDNMANMNTPGFKRKDAYFYTRTRLCLFTKNCSSGKEGRYVASMDEREST